MLVAYGVRKDGSRQLLAFLRSQGESQAAWEGLLNDLYRRGLLGKKLELIVSDGCPGLAALQTVYPRVAHQRCWVHIAGRDPRFPEGWNVPSRASPYEPGSLGPGIAG